MKETRDNFYKKALGMSELPGGNVDVSRFTFGRQMQNQFLELTTPDGCRAGSFPRNGVYWKCGILSPDVDALATKLRNDGYSFGEASQFLDIGYLGHGSDESGLTTELLQHSFQSNFSPAPARALSEATLGQLTIRTGDIAATLAFYQGVLDWVILSHQSVSQYGFALYFLAGRDVGVPPPADPDAVELREPLWASPFMTLEIQYFVGSGGSVDAWRPPSSNTAGFLGMVVGVSADGKAAVLRKAQEAGCKIEGDVVFDPNGIPLHLEVQ